MKSIIKILRDIFSSDAASHKPFSVGYRFIKWQFRHRVLGRSLEFSTITGSRMRLIPGASDSLSSFWYHQLPDFDEMVFALHILQSGGLFVDVGANQGGWSLMIAGNNEVIAFEPIPATRERFIKNVEMNTDSVKKRIKVYDCGLGCREEVVIFTANLDTVNHQIDGKVGSCDTVEVKLRRMDDVLVGVTPKLIKIDVEGAELNVLKGANDVLSGGDLCAVIMETFKSDQVTDRVLHELEGLLAQYGFKPISYDAYNRSLVPLGIDEPRNQNTIYIRDLDLIKQLLNRAKPLRLWGRNF